jgi:hypothetical protein
MLLNTTVRVGTPDGPEATVVVDENSTITLLTAMAIQDGTSIFDSDGNYIATLSSTSASAATFYESRTEQQTIEEDGPSGPYDFGWRAKHLGWIVDFEKGTVLYGKLAALNQNRQNVGIEGPTDVSGTNGSPSSLFQKVNISGRPAQVNGWKSFDSPTAYVLDPLDVQQTDSAYIYADAFVSWTADSATVSSPGSDMNTLEEYSPTNSVVYTAFP